MNIHFRNGIKLIVILLYHSYAKTILISFTEYITRCIHVIIKFKEKARDVEM